MSFFLRKQIAKISDPFILLSKLLCQYQVINPTKSSIWFSPNTPQSNINEAVSVLGFLPSSNLGSYLGFPLSFSGRNSDFNFIVERVENRISSWKSKYLSPIGKSVLIKSVCFAILAYFMQCLPFPKGICAKFDKIFRKFFWSSINNDHKLHLVSWDKITKRTNDGGLGIFKTYERSIAFNSKMVWRTKSETHLPWVQICLRKLHLKSFANSPIGKCLSRGYDICSRGLRHVIHSGVNTNFWFDPWVPQGTFRSIIHGPIPRHQASNSVSDFVGNGSVWDWSNISFVWPSDLLNSLESIPRNFGERREDSVSWIFNSNGQFSLKSAYNIAISSQFPTVNSGAGSSSSWIRKAQCPPRLKFFIWLNWHNSLPSNFSLASRGIAVNPVCPMCGAQPETLQHLFLDCYFASFLSQVFLGDFFGIPTPRRVGVG